MQALGGLLGSRGAKKAAKAREQAYRDAADLTSGAYNRAEDFFDPRLDQERSAMDRVNALLGLSGEEVDYDLFRETPGYQFALEQGRQAIERSAAAGGGLVSGNTLAALTEYGQGLADQNFQNYLANVMGLQNQGVDAALAGMAVDEGNALANLRLGRGGAVASGIEGSTSALTGALSGISGALGGAAGRNALTGAGTKGVKGVPAKNRRFPTVRY